VKPAQGFGRRTIEVIKIPDNTENVANPLEGAVVKTALRVGLIKVPKDMRIGGRPSFFSENRKNVEGGR
jgi:hypothetical protein